MIAKAKNLIHSCLLASMKNLLLLSFVLICFIPSNVKSQSLSETYDFAIGVKMYPGAITLKKSIGDDKYLEGIAAFWKRGVRTTVLYEVQAPLFNVDGLNWYYGGGAHAGFYKSKEKENTSTNLLGIDGVLGIDYKIKGAPINLSLDWQPSFEFGNGGGFEGWGGLGVRIAF